MLLKLWVFVVGVTAMSACGREPVSQDPQTSKPTSQPAAAAVATPVESSAEREAAEFAQEGKRIQEAHLKACANFQQNGTAIETLAEELKESKAKRGASLDDPLNQKEAEYLADMRRLLALNKECTDAGQREVAHAVEAKRRAVHAYVNELKDKPKPR